MNAFSDVEKTVDIPVSKQQPTTTRKIDDQVLIDEHTRKKWDEARDGKETTAALIAVNEIALHILKHVDNCAMGDLVQLVEQYMDLSLAGSCSAWAKSAVKVLKATEKRIIDERITDMKKPAVRKSLHHMKRKLRLLNEIEEDVRKGVSG